MAGSFVSVLWSTTALAGFMPPPLSTLPRRTALTSQVPVVMKLQQQSQQRAVAISNPDSDWGGLPAAGVPLPIPFRNFAVA